jgi:glutaredoxin
MSVIVWSKENCPYCERAKLLLDNYSIAYELRVVGEGWTREQLLEAVPTARSVPQIVINDEVIGGYDALTKYLEETNYNGTGHTL